MNALRRAVAACTRYVRAHPLGFLVVLAAALRFAWVLHAAKPAVDLNDPLAYQLFAVGIADGDGYVTSGGRATAYFPIGYPGSLGVFFWLVDLLPWTVKPHVMVAMFNFVPSVAIVVLTFLIARALYGERVAFAAGLFVAVWPNLVFHTAVAMSETLFVALLLGACYALVARPWTARPSTARLMVAGGLLGASALVRPLTLLWLPVLALVLHKVVGSWKQALAATATVAAVVAIVLLPWAVRNTITFDEPVLVSTNGGDDLCIGHNATATGAYRLAPVCNATAEERADEPEHDRRNTRRALDYAISHPGREVSLLFLKAYHTLRDDHDALDAIGPYLREATDRRHTYRLVFAAIADAWFWAMAAMALLAVTQRRRTDARATFVFYAAAVLALAPLVFFGNPRFKVPVEPFLAIAAAVTLDRMIGAANGRWRTAPASSG